MRARSGADYVERHMLCSWATSLRARSTRSVSLIGRRSYAARCARPDGLSVLLAGNVETDCADRSLRRDDRVEAMPEHGMQPILDRFDLGSFADCRDSGCRLENIRIDGDHLIRDPDLPRSRHQRARLLTPHGCTRPAAITTVVTSIYPAERVPTASLLRINK